MTIACRFVSGSPRNDLMTNRTFLAVEKLNGSSWEVVATDADWDTRYNCFYFCLPPFNHDYLIYLGFTGVEYGCWHPARQRFSGMCHRTRPLAGIEFDTLVTTNQ